MSFHLAARAQSMTRRVSLRAIFYMCVASLCFSLVELVGQYMVHDVSPYFLVWARYVVHLLFMLIILGPHYKTRLVKTSNLKLQFLRSMTMLAMPICFILATQRMPSNDVWSVYWLSPLVALALSTWILREPAGSTRWIVALLGLIGTLFIVQPDAGIFSTASVLAFGMGVCISVHLMLSRVLRYDHPLASLFHTALWVFVILSFFVPFLWKIPSLTSLIGMVLIGLIGVAGLFALARSGELAPLPVVASFAYTETIWTLLLKLVLFGTLPGLRMILGALVIAGVSGYSLLYESSPAETIVLSPDVN